MRSSVAIPPVAARRPRLPHAKTAALVAVQLAFVGVLLWFCLPQALGGRAGWVLVSGTSMLPHLHSGDLVLVERQSKYHLGEVIAYRIPQATVGAGNIVIHRIVGGSGKTGWKMQGDNRTAPDLWHPKKRDIVGAKQLRIPHAWFVLRILHMPLLLGLFAACAAFFLIALARDEEADSDGEEA
jgi:signal peptidase I